MDGRVRVDRRPIRSTSPDSYRRIGPLAENGHVNESLAATTETVAVEPGAEHEVNAIPGHDDQRKTDDTQCS